jgi:large subunit ribosomal protein L17
MRHRDTTKIFSRPAAARNAMFRDVATSLVTYEKVETTLAKAKAVRPIVERLITKAKRGDLSARRQLIAFFTTSQPVAKLMEVLGPRYKDRQGGYTRITKLGTRQGDAAEMVQFELV